MFVTSAATARFLDLLDWGLRPYLRPMLHFLVYFGKQWLHSCTGMSVGRVALLWQLASGFDFLGVQPGMLRMRVSRHGCKICRLFVILVLFASSPLSMSQFVLTLSTCLISRPTLAIVSAGCLNSYMSLSCRQPPRALPSVLPLVSLTKLFDCQCCALIVSCMPGPVQLLHCLLCCAGA